MDGGLFIRTMTTILAPNLDSDMNKPLPISKFQSLVFFFFFLFAKLIERSESDWSQNGGLMMISGARLSDLFLATQTPHSFEPFRDDPCLIYHLLTGSKNQERRKNRRN